MTPGGTVWHFACACTLRVLLRAHTLTGLTTDPRPILLILDQLTGRLPGALLDRGFLNSNLAALWPITYVVPGACASRLSAFSPQPPGLSLARGFSVYILADSFMGIASCGGLPDCCF